MENVPQPDSISAMLDGPLENVDFVASVLEGLDLPYSELEKIKSESGSLAQMAKVIKKVKEDLEIAARVKAEIQKFHDFLTINVVPEMMEEQEVDTLKVPGVGRLQCSSDIRCTVPAAKKELLGKWLAENGHGALVKRTINPSTLKVLIKDLIKGGKNWPSNIVKVDPYSRATVVKV